MTDTIASLHAMLDADPGDQATRAVLADACEESGDSRTAEALRWLARTGNYPDVLRGFKAADTFFWWRWSEGDMESALLMANYLPAHSSMFVWERYVTRQQAEEAFVDAYHAAKVKGWVPTRAFCPRTTRGGRMPTLWPPAN